MGMQLQRHSVVVGILHAVLVAVLCLVVPQASAAANPSLVSTTQLRVDVARELAAVALSSCARHGSDVSVSVVDPHGQLQVFLRADTAAPHTAELSEHKAYTAVSLAALQGLHTTSELADAMHQSKAPVGLLSLPADSVRAITPVPGGVVLRQGDQLVGALGVSGARTGQADEQCALAAETWLIQLLEAPSNDEV